MAITPRYEASPLRFRVLGGLSRFFDIRKAFTDALFLGLQNVGNFEFAVKSEAIVDARWVRNMYSPAHSVPCIYGVWCAPDYLHIHTSRGASTIARFTAMVFPTTLKAE